MGSRSLISLSLVIFLPICGADLKAQSTSLEKLKVAYLFKFSKFFNTRELQFTKSPSTVRCCFVNSSPFAQIARQIMPQKLVEIVELEQPEEIKRCDIAYLNPENSFNLLPFLELTRESPILTVNESVRFLEEGGILRFFLNEDSKLRFEVNLDQAIRSGIYFNAQFLRLSKIRKEP